MNEPVGWIKKNGLYEYSIKRLSLEDREAAIKRIQEQYPLTDELKRFLKIDLSPIT